MNQIAYFLDITKILCLVQSSASSSEPFLTNATKLKNNQSVHRKKQLTHTRLYISLWTIEVPSVPYLHLYIPAFTHRSRCRDPHPCIYHLRPGVLFSEDVDRTPVCGKLQLPGFSPTQSFGSTPITPTPKHLHWFLVRYR